MAEGRRLPLADAERLAAEVVALLGDACERIEIAGSVRRKKPDVGDLEIVCVPSVLRVTALDLFGEEREAKAHNRLDVLVADLLGDGTFGHRPDKNGRNAAGERYKRLTYKGVGLDLFSCLPPAQFGVLFTIRTGSAEFSHKLVTPRLLGGWLPTGLKVEHGAVWEAGRVIETPNEQDFFDAISVRWLLPELRTPDRTPVLFRPVRPEEAGTGARHG